MSAQLSIGQVRTAILSDCGRYRYSLTRQWGAGPRVCWLMLNPSTADAEKDDPTIRKCVGFSKAWGYGSLVVVNLFAWRSTDPRALRAAEDPVGPENDGAIERAAGTSVRVIAAWGAHLRGSGRYARGAHVRALVARRGVPVYHLGFTADGDPRHPLMLPYRTAPVLW